MLGAERLVYGHLGGAPQAADRPAGHRSAHDPNAFTLRIAGTDHPPHPGDTVWLQAPAVRLHWFDATTGQRVEE